MFVYFFTFYFKNQQNIVRMKPRKGGVSFLMMALKEH